MKGILLLLFLCLTSYSVIGQLNFDSKKIKKKRIKSVVFNNETKCVFDTEGRITRLEKGTFHNGLKALAPCKEFAFDSLGYFLKVIEVNGKLDTTLCWKSELKNGEIIVSNYRQVKSDGDAYYGEFREFNLRDTAVLTETKYTIDDGDTIFFHTVYFRALVAISSNKAKMIDGSFDYGSNAEESVRSELGKNYLSSYISEYDKSGVNIQSWRIASNGDTISHYSYKPLKGDSVIVQNDSDESYKDRKRYNLAGTKQIGFEEYYDMSLYPSKYMRLNRISCLVEYYD
jgi:hypothetical protein